MAGNCLANSNEPIMQQLPPTINVLGAPMLLAKLPANKLPKGAIPRNAIVNKLITRPRLSSSTIVWITVLLEAISRIEPKPISKDMSKESQRTWDKAKPISPIPQSAGAKAMTLPKPSTVGQVLR